MFNCLKNLPAYSAGDFLDEYGGLIGIKLHPSNYISLAADNYHFC
jgi:hypothetical protein